MRAIPRSRHNPQYKRDSLREYLPDIGVKYVHVPGLGGRREPRPDSVNSGW